MKFISDMKCIRNNSYLIESCLVLLIGISHSNLITMGDCFAKYGF